MDEDIARLVSLLEGSVSPTAAKEALVAAGGNLEGAIRRLFEKSAPKSGGTTAAVEVETPWADLFADDSPSEPDRDRHGSQPSRPPKRSRRQLPDWARPQEAPQTKRTKSALSLEDRPKAAPATRSAAATGVEGRIFLSERAVETGVEDTWTSFTPTNRGVFSLGGQNWREGVLSKDPPCLSLRFNESDSRPTEGATPLRLGWVAVDSEEFAAGASWTRDGHVSLRVSLLETLFDSLLLRVRYPPASLEYSWKAKQLSTAPQLQSKVAPSDLRGPLPDRPFRLLNNTEDTPAAQPPRFTEHPLRTEQLRSLSWMLACEGHNDAGDIDPFVVEWRQFWTPGLSGVPSLGEGGEHPQVVEGARVRIRKDASGPVLDQTTKAPLKVIPTDEGRLIKYEGYDAILAHVTSRSGQNYLCHMQDLEFVDHGELEIGCLVRLATGLTKPAYGWGGVARGDTGVLLSMSSDQVVVRFQAHPGWKGMRAEVERADSDTSGSGNRPCVLDLRVQASYPVRGGILADRIGYGKTATMIGLMDTTLEYPLPPLPEEDRTGFIPAKGTLVVVPSNLHEQWLAEISKFVWGGKPLRGALKGGWSPKGCPWKIFAMSNVTPLTKVKAGELAEADVVLCSYRLLFSPIYQERRKEIGEGAALTSLVKSTRRLLEGKSEVRSGRKGSDTTSRWEDLAFPVIEMFHWKRVVFDEFHELESFESLQQNSLQHIRASYRWGLTGTPPVDGSAGTVFMSSLFRVDIPGFLERPSSPTAYPDLTIWETDRLLAEHAGRFLDRFARQNTAELPEVKLEEHVIIVQHSAAERALYLGQAHDAPHVDAEGGLSQEHVQELERLLKLCSHFQAVGDNVASAQQECERIGEQKERRVVRAQNQLWRCAHVIELLKPRLPKASAADDSSWRGDLAAAVSKMPTEGEGGQRALQALEKVTQEAALTPPVDYTAVLEHHRPRDPELAGLLAAGDSKKGYSDQWAEVIAMHMPGETVLRLIKAQAQEQAENLRELHEADNSLGFFRRTMATLAQNEAPDNRSCTVCLEEGLPLTRLAITPCAHMFCLDCLKMTITKFSSCSICRQPLSLKDIRPLEMELSRPPPAEPAVGASSSSSSSSSSSAPVDPFAGQAQRSADAEQISFDKYGTKLAALVRKLRELRAGDPTAKVILFVQFDDLKRKVASVLAEFGVPAVQLQGSVSQRSSIIRDWQYNPTSASFVLLLSLAQSASGTNLTAAGHVVFLHPMLAPTPERAVGHELQAIGRARRFGQQRDVVHVWRFVTAGTVEQTMTEKHQSALWEREQARGSAGTTTMPPSEGTGA